MIKIRHADNRGHTQLDWLNGRHSFSFGRYVDREHMGYQSLRVINDDRVAGGGGFATHPHDNMEIITYILSGELAHKDSMGNGSVIKPGDVQIMSAGTGVEHSEFNHSDTVPVHLLQMWITPKEQNLKPSYDQMHFSAQEKQGALKLIGSHDGRDDSIKIHQDVDLYAAIINDADTVSFDLRNNSAWLQVATGSVTLNGQALKEGDGAAIEGETITLSKGENAEIVMFEFLAN